MIDLWYSIIHSAKRIPFRDASSHQRLVELLKSIKSSKPPPTAANPDLYFVLRDFGMCARESMNDSPGYGAGFLLPEAHAYTNLNYFWALLTKHKIINLWTWVIWAMRDALEDSPTAAKSGQYSSGTVQEKTTAFVPAAAVWVFVLGRELYLREQDLTPKRATEGNTGRGGELWKGKSEFSKERWALWKSRFETVSEMEDLTEEVRKIAGEAVECMARSVGAVHAS